MESLSTWTSLRRDGLCGLTADEAEVLKQALRMATAGSRVDCVTTWPCKGSMPFQVGRRVYYRSSLPVPEFLSSLRTLDSADGFSSASYLPRDSKVSTPHARIDTRALAEEVGEWCILN
jgi:hypothetical protein